jgi:Pyruvate/2-oxoacid:ferredoxin oxidoreductase delta subunit
MTAKRQTKAKQAKTVKGKVAKKAEVKSKKAKTKAPKKRFEVEFYRDWCKGCGICAAFCPEEVLAMNENAVPTSLSALKRRKQKRSVKPSLVSSKQQVIRSQNPESRSDTAQGARHKEYIGQRVSFGPEPYALSLMPSPKAN